MLASAREDVAEGRREGLGLAVPLSLSFPPGVAALAPGRVMVGPRPPNTVAGQPGSHAWLAAGVRYSRATRCWPTKLTFAATKPSTMSAGDSPWNGARGMICMYGCACPLPLDETAYGRTGPPVGMDTQPAVTASTAPAPSAAATRRGAWLRMAGPGDEPGFHRGREHV